MKLVIFSPSMVNGGTASLFARVARYWNVVTGGVAEVIDFEDGATVRALRKTVTPFVLRAHKRGMKHRFAEDEMLLISLLSARALGHQLLPSPETRLALWLTHPQDAFKWIPTFQFARTWSPLGQYWYSRCLHPRYFPRLRAAFLTGVSRGGIWSMDESCSAAICTQYALTAPPILVPLITDAAPPTHAVRRAWTPISTETLRIWWVGRLADFKVGPLLALIADVRAILAKGAQVTLTVVGDGESRKPIETAAVEQLGSAVRFLGEIDLTRLDTELLGGADLVCGHGTVTLEAARLSIPSLIVDAFYFRSRAGETRYQWFHETPVTYVGKIIDSRNEFVGKTFEHALTQLAVADVGAACFAHWSSGHEPIAGTARLAELLDADSLTYADLVAAGIDNFDAIGTAAMSFKRWWTAEKY